MLHCRNIIPWSKSKVNFNVGRCCRAVSTSRRSQVTKKDTSSGLARAYDLRVVEPGWYEWWEGEGHFQHAKSSAPEFSMLLPPPNVTGTLHLGHALTCTVQDVIARWRRMRGDVVTWVPGSDHAGIATQAVVERHLARTFETRPSREHCLEEAWRWRQEKGQTIMKQLRQLGSSLDWSREFFTLDERQNLAVREAFVRLHQAGLVYRADTHVNWSCALRSAIADVEVEWRNLDGPTMLRVPVHAQAVQFGMLTHVALPLTDGDGELVVATTRVETMLGDVAVAVHPDDTRYSSLIGRHVSHPLRDGQPIPIIADDFVDREFGTGAVKITPAHDAADYEVSLRHSLPCESVILEDGTIAPQWPTFAGLNRFAAREAIQQRLGQLGLLRGSSPVASAKIPLCSRSGDVVEQLLRPQWFIRCEDMAAQAMDAVTRGDLVIDPPVFQKVWFDWLGNIRDWCVSRQLWWGHRVPAYFCSASSNLNEGVWVVARDEDEARSLAARELGTSQQIEIRQDTDILDTWFSSALLPFSSLGWPDSSAPDLKRLFPLSLMETGHDILFFWVARMVMLSKQLTGNLPFKKVLLHGVVCDAYGRKMSKSLGNVIHPEDVIHGAPLQSLLDRVKESNAASGASAAECERALSAQRVSFPQGIPACGTDALRFTLVSHNVKAHTVTFDIGECYTNKLFCNKIFQATHFVLSAMQQRGDDFTLLDERKLGLMERWILSRQARTVQRVEDALEKFNLHEATAALKRFFYGEFCDVYLECSKPALKNELQAREAVYTLVTCLTTSLNLFAPFMPFLCEELYNHLPSSIRKHESIHQSEFPTAKEWSRFRDLAAENDAKLVLSVVHAIRRLKAEAALSKAETKIKVQITEGIELELLQQHRTIIQILSACAELEFSTGVPDSSLFEVLSPTCKVYLLGQHGNSIKKRLQKKEKIEKEIEKLLNIMSAKGYSSKAPTNVQEAHKIKLEHLQAELKKFIPTPQSTS